MKAITICQPYAHLIAIGDKFVENRTWETKYRGVLAIHAGLSRKWMDAEDEFRYPDLGFGAVIAICTLENVIHIDDIPDRIARHEHTEGPWCFILGDVKDFWKPVPMRGRQLIWEVAEEFNQLIEEAQR